MISQPLGSNPLCVADCILHRTAAYLLLFCDAFRQNGTCVRLFRVQEKLLQQLLDMLPDFAEQMGSIPIVFDLR